MSHLRRNRARGKGGFVYLIAPEAALHRPEFDEGALVKIGYTADHPSKRLRNFQTGSPVCLRIWAYFDGSPSLEIALHNTFSSLRSHGEWFFIQRKLWAFMAYMADEPYVGNHVDREFLEVAVADNIFSSGSHFPEYSDEEWDQSGDGRYLAKHFPDLWAEYQE